MSYLDVLPAIYREETPDTERSEGSAFLEGFLSAFEKLFSGGVGDPADGFETHFKTGHSEEIQHLGLEQILDRIADYLDPGATPVDFLDRLAEWVALTLRDDWSPDEKRELIAGAVPAHRWRGTRQGLREILSAYTGLGESTITIAEHVGPIQVGRRSTVGINTMVGLGGLHFTVRVTVKSFEDLGDGAGAVQRKWEIVHAIVEAEKPAHTTFSLELIVPTLRVGFQSTVGKDTILMDTNQPYRPRERAWRKVSESSPTR